jgi:hypothetical protein
MSTGWAICTSISTKFNYLVFVEWNFNQNLKQYLQIRFQLQIILSDFQVFFM